MRLRREGGPRREREEWNETKERGRDQGERGRNGMRLRREGGTKERGRNGMRLRREGGTKEREGGME